MANHAWAIFNKKVDIAVLAGHLRTYNAKRFGGCLEIIHDANGVTATSPEGRRFDYWRRSTRSLEWAHSHGDVEWWLKETLASYMCRQFQENCTIADEGIDGKLEPNFDLKYPTASDWISAQTHGLFSRGIASLIVPDTSPIYWVNPL